MTKFVVKMANLSGKTVVIAEIIRKRRKEMGYNQAKMAKIMGISARTYQRKENGQMSIDDLSHICNVLNLAILIVLGEII